MSQKASTMIAMNSATTANAKSQLSFKLRGITSAPGGAGAMTIC
jgi:hypothetical protein